MLVVLIWGKKYAWILFTKSLVFLCFLCACCPRIPTEAHDHRIFLTSLWMKAQFPSQAPPLHSLCIPALTEDVRKLKETAQTLSRTHVAPPLFIQYPQRAHTAPQTPSGVSAHTYPLHSTGQGGRSRTDASTPLRSVCEGLFLSTVYVCGWSLGRYTLHRHHT